MFIHLASLFNLCGFFAAECSELTQVTFGKCNDNNHNQLLITIPAGIHGLDLSMYVKGSRSCSVEFKNYYEIRSWLQVGLENALVSAN